MRTKLIIKLGIIGLAVIFFLGMASYSTDQEATSQGKPERTPELYEVSITINGNNPGIDTGTGLCGSFGHFYAGFVGMKKRQTVIQRILQCSRDFRVGVAQELGA